MAVSSVARLLCRRCQARANTLSVFNRQSRVSPAAANFLHSSILASSFSASLASLPESTINEGRESVEVARQPWRVVVAIYVQRMPSLSREKTSLLLQHKEMLDQLIREKSKFSDFELEMLEHNRAKKDRIKKTLEDEQSKTRAGDEADEFDDVQEARELELLEFKPAPRETEADRLGDMRSLNRKLDRVLYLLVKKPRKEHAWQMPQGGVEPGESLLEAAKRELVEECGSGLDVKFYSPAPHAVLSYRHPPQSGHASRQVGSKVFFMKAFCYGNGDVELDNKELEDYMWVTREEMQTYVSEQYFQSIGPILAE